MEANSREMSEMSKKIEAVLFFRGEPVAKKELARLIEVSDSDIDVSIEELKDILKNRGVVLVDRGDKVMLGTSPELSEFMESVSKEEVEKDLTKAAVETLSIILYRSPVTRSEIDFIRGVNSTFILRNLLVRGLIDRKADENDKRSYVYEPSIELLAHLGISSVEEVPQYKEVTSKIKTFLEQSLELEPNEDHRQTEIG